MTKGTQHEKSHSVETETDGSICFLCRFANLCFKLLSTQWSTSLYRYRILWCGGMQSKHRTKSIVKHCCLTLEKELLVSALDTAAWYRASFSFKETVSSKSISVFPALAVLSSGNPLTRLRRPAAKTKRSQFLSRKQVHFFLNLESRSRNLVY